LLGITVDNIPTLHAWTKLMGKLWFPGTFLFSVPMALWQNVEVVTIENLKQLSLNTQTYE
jgi:hypothetical protein